jgi:hypothetical protein
VVTVEGKREKLRQRWLALLAGDRPHRYENPGRAYAVFDMVVHEPLR